EIDEADFDPEEEIRLVEKLLYDNSSPRPSEEFNSENYDAVIESFSPSPIPVEGSDSLMEEIDIFLASDDSIPPSFHFDRYYDPSYPRPPAKPPDDDGIYFDVEPDTRILTVKVVGYCKNLKKMVKTGQTRTRERKDNTRAKRMLSKKSTREKETAAQVLLPHYGGGVGEDVSMIDDEEARDNFLKDVYTFLRNEEISEYYYDQAGIVLVFNFNNDDDEYMLIWRRPKAITPDEPFEEPEDPLIMGEEELSTIPEKNKFIRDISIMSPKINFLSEEFAGKLAPIPPGMNEDEFDEEEDDCYNDDTLSDDDSYENIEYVEASHPDSELVSLEEVEPDQGELISIVISNNSNDPLLEPPEFESFHFDLYDDLLFPCPPPEPPDVEISLIVETDAPVINNVDELNEEPFLTIYQFGTFSPVLTYPEVSLLLSSIGNEDTIFDPGIST
ncbi:hypothetical protein Tco_0352287, partial [Tanacetum coccineum]